MRDSLELESWYRDVPGRFGAGVCASIAKRFGWSVTLVRLAFVVSLAFSGGLACWVYLAFWAITPFNPSSKAPAQKLFRALHSFFTTTVDVEPSAQAVAPAEGPSNVARVD